LPHRLLIALCSDFYRPKRVTEIHGLLYENRYFNPDSSPLVVRQAIKRLRQELIAASVPLEISLADGAYRAHPGKTCALLVEDRPLPMVNKSLELDALRQGLAETEFTTKQLMSAANLSLSTATRLIRHGLESGAISKTGNGPRTCYRFRK